MEIPKEIQNIMGALNKAGFEAYVVGGCVRDLLLRKKPADWDVATNARPGQIKKVFPESFYANDFGTVTVLTKSDRESLKEVEVTTYRVEANYTDKRHPDSVSFSGSLKEDLSRRDFTVNAMALKPENQELRIENQEMVKIGDSIIIDPFGGIKDLNDKLIRAVGKPGERFSEDALRLMRTVRLATQLNFNIEDKTKSAVNDKRELIKAISKERIRDELVKIVMSDNPERGFDFLRQCGLLEMILPEVEGCVDVDQNKHHTFSVYTHCVKSLQYAAKYGYPLHVRLAALLHDIGKPRTRRAKGNDYTFHAHEVVGARLAERLMKRLRFSNDLIKKVVHLCRHHMFYYDVGKVTEAGARRLLQRVGRDNFDDLIKLRIAERKGSGVPKAEPYRLRHLQFLVEKASREPLTVKELAITGGDLVKELNLKPGPIIGGILNALLAEVINDPSLNKRKLLLKRADQLKNKDPEKLKDLGEEAREKEERKREEDIKRKYYV